MWYLQYCRWDGLVAHRPFNLFDDSFKFRIEQVAGLPLVDLSDLAATGSLFDLDLMPEPIF